MATGTTQIAGFAVSGGDIPVHNYGNTDIAEGLGVLIDSSNVMGPSAGIGVVLPTASGGVAGTLGIAIETIPAGRNGRVRVAGAYPMTANGTVTAGQTVMISDTTSKLGWVKTQTTAGEQLGLALGTASDGNTVLVLVDRAKNA